MANFAFTSTQKWVHIHSLTGQEYNILQPKSKVSIVPMDTSLAGVLAGVFLSLMQGLTLQARDWGSAPEKILAF